MSEEIVWTKEYKVERYRKMNKDIKKGSVLFAGSSLMEMFLSSSLRLRISCLSLFIIVVSAVLSLTSL